MFGWLKRKKLQVAKMHHAVGARVRPTRTHDAQPVFVAAPPDPARVHCPNCTTAKPAYVVFPLFDALVHHGGRHELVEAGARLACQNCGEVYSVWRGGTFEQNARSYPPTLRHGANVPVAAAQANEGEIDPEAPPLRPMPRTRPTGRA